MDDRRLDILLYAHDGRGLGHVSRTVAIGMALRRRHPRLRVLLVTGCRHSQELIDVAPLDWLKLPSYETEVKDGRSRGITGRSNFTDRQLAELRSSMLCDIDRLYRPRIILCDHSPQGKHQELLPLLAQTKADLYLGLRAVIGQVKQVASPEAAATFKRSFQGLLWYGDQHVLGRDHLQALSRLFGVTAQPCGYVSRLLELKQQTTLSQPASPPLAATIALPWIGEHSLPAALALANGLRTLVLELPLHVYLGGSSSAGEREQLEQAFHSLGHCSVFPLGSGYLRSLARSQRAIIYGGYNSIVDVLALGLPSLVLLRSMADLEQQQHLARLSESGIHLLRAIAEEDHAALADLDAFFQATPSLDRQGETSVALAGAEVAADLLAKACQHHV